MVIPNYRKDNKVRKCSQNYRQKDRQSILQQKITIRPSKRVLHNHIKLLWKYFHRNLFQDTVQKLSLIYH